MLLRVRFVVAAVVAVSGLAVLPAPTQAADHDFCTEYAQEALRQFERARESGCPDLSYPTWSMDFDHHYNWCRSVPETDALAGRKLRTDALARCQAEGQQGTVTGVIEMADPAAAVGAVLRQPCLDYAASAVAQQAQNLEQQCGLAGPQWNSNLGDHYNWCVHGENVQNAERERLARQQALDRCTARARESSAPPLDKGPEDAAPLPSLKAVDDAAFPGGTLIIDAMQASTAPEPTCADLRDSLVAMIQGGGLARAADGSLSWKPAQPSTLDPSDPLVTQIANSNPGDLNAQIQGFTQLHKSLRTARLAAEFQTIPLADLRLSAVTGTLSANLRPDNLARLDQWRSARGGGFDTAAMASAAATQPGLADPSRARAMPSIRLVCALARPGGDAAAGTTLWENGYAFLIGHGFGWTPGTVQLEYEACGGDAAQSCEDRRMAGQPVPTRKIDLQPISRFAWSDRLIGVRLPAALPDQLVTGVAGPRLWLAAAGGAAVASPPVRMAKVMPHVWSLKTDSGFDPGGLVFDGRWVHWQNPKAVRHEIFWVWSQRLVQGAGLINIDCEGCPKGTRLQSAHLAAPGDSIYVYGQGFGPRPGRVFLTYDDPTAPGFDPRTATGAVPVEAGGTDWWRDDRIHIRVPKSTPPPNQATFPSLVIVDHKGRWISGRYGLSFAPEMAVKVVSGKTWFDLGTGEDDKVVTAPDNSSMIVSHPTGGCASLGIIPIDTNERGDDDFFYKGRLPAGVRVISAEFMHLDPQVSQGQFLASWSAGLSSSVAKYGPLGLFTFYGSQAVESMLRSLGGDQGQFYIYPRKVNGQNADDPRVYVSWVNTCVGPYADRTINYSARFILSGPKNVLYP